ncbi:MAG: ABC transporter permease [Methanolinea sp.]|jgi:hypothetical protein|nr:ABC transporter permease [Methanolinea sp.]
MSYLVYVAAFGTLAVFFLWLRDVRIFLRTNLAGYRNAAYRGVLYGALAILGCAFTFSSTERFPTELIGLGVLLAALYFQGKVTREKVFINESTWDRLLGNAPLKKRPPEREG